MCSNPCFWSSAVLETVIKLATISVVFIPDSMINYPPPPPPPHPSPENARLLSFWYSLLPGWGHWQRRLCTTLNLGYAPFSKRGGCNLESVRTWIWQATAKLLAPAPSAVSKGAPCWCGSKKIGQSHKSIQLIKHIDMLKLPAAVLPYSFVHLLSSDWPPLAFTPPPPGQYSPLLLHWPSLHLTHVLGQYNNNIYIFFFIFFHSHRWSKNNIPQREGKPALKAIYRGG